MKGIANAKLELRYGGGKSIDKERIYQMKASGMGQPPTRAS
jgi:hypothetical protein